ncbi:MAG: hypothetical protein K0U84_14050 [Actinomycetia bacterium]|nr:hypothetical protein [Actinomycetes bacterium]
MESPNGHLTHVQRRFCYMLESKGTIPVADLFIQWNMGTVHTLETRGILTYTGSNGDRAVQLTPAGISALRDSSPASRQHDLDDLIDIVRSSYGQSPTGYVLVMMLEKMSQIEARQKLLSARLPDDDQAEADTTREETATDAP